MASVDRQAFKFFLANAGYVAGKRAACALDLARAEKEAKTRGWVFNWENDNTSAFNDGPREWGWEDDEVKRWEMKAHDVEGCILFDENGDDLASLWGIWDADNTYRRVVEAELAEEALADVRRQEVEQSKADTDAKRRFFSQIGNRILAGV